MAASKAHANNAYFRFRARPSGVTMPIQPSSKMTNGIWNATVIPSSSSKTKRTILLAGYWTASAGEDDDGTGLPAPPPHAEPAGAVAAQPKGEAQQELEEAELALTELGCLPGLADLPSWLGWIGCLGCLAWMAGLGC